MFGLFQKVTYTCTACGARQRIPRRRIHFFERFHDLTQGQAVLIVCPICFEGLQIPTPYKAHTGHLVDVDPSDPLRNAVVSS